MAGLSMSQWIFGHVKEPEAAVETLLLRMRRRLYPETLPVLASCWLRTICSGGHNRVWWQQLKDSMHRTLREERLEPFSHDVLLSTLNWTENNVLATGEPPAARRFLEPPYRSLAPERLVTYIGRLLNEWLPAEVARMLTDEEESRQSPDDGIPALAIAKALDRLLLRERLSPETLEMFLAPELLSPRLVYPADVEILHDVVLALLGRDSAPALPILPAVLLGATGGSALPAEYDEALRHASYEHSEDRDELHVPIAEQDALRILSHDPVRIGSVVVTMDGRAWQPWRLQRGEQNLIVYASGDRLRIDCTADHAKLTVPWPEMPSSWPGAGPRPGPFELFGREWRESSWDMDGEATRLHLTFSRVLPIAEAPPRESVDGRVHPAYVDMGWSELERALGEAAARRSRDPIEQMRRAELIPLGRALFGFAESVQSNWRWNSRQIETQLRAVLYHEASLVSAYGRVPWRIVPIPVQASLAKRRLKPGSMALLAEIFNDVPKIFGESARRGPSEPPQAA
jgi:hypothetical protein